MPLLVQSAPKIKVRSTLADSHYEARHLTINWPLDPHNRVILPIPGESGRRQMIQNAFQLARTGKAPILDVERCIKGVHPSKFLQLLWSELVDSANLGETESCRRIATFVLTMPRSPNTPPLLPIFLHNVTPWIIAAIDEQPHAEHTVNVELLVTIVSSVLTAALQLELSMRSVTNKQDFVLGQLSAAMARRFAGDLRARKNSPTSRIIGQRLTSSQSFVANFPVFLGDI